MNLVSITPVRNEECWIRASLTAALRWVDSAVVLLHACTDRSEQIVRSIAEETGRVEVLVEPSQDWAEMNHRQTLLEAARRRGATHIALVDADEILTGNLLPRIRDAVKQLPAGAFLQAPLPCLWGSLDQYAVRAISRHGRFQADWGRSVTSVAFADAPTLEWRRHGNYDHHHREPFGSRWGASLSAGGVMHLQFAHRRRLVAKHALYKMAEVLKYPWKSRVDIDAMYTLAIEPEHVMLTDTPAAWWEPYSDLKRSIDLESEPWHEVECRRLLDQYGEGKFAGLNLFGVVQPCAQAV